MNNMNAFDLTVSALREKGLNPDEILEELSKMFRNMAVTEAKKNPSEENTTEALNDSQKEKKLQELFLRIGIPRNLKGYHYAIKAVLFYEKNPNQKMEGSIYPAIAKEFKITSYSVGRAIRHAIERAIDNCTYDVLYEIFGNTISPNKGKPTNWEFIAMCAEWLNR